MSILPVIVGHQDTLLSLYSPERGQGRDFFVRSKIGHLDLPRAQEGGIAGGFFAVFVPRDPSLPSKDFEMLPAEVGYRVRMAEPVEHTYAMRTAMAMVALLFRLEDQAQGQLKVVQNVGELQYCLQTGVHAAILHFEGAEAIDPDLNALEVFYRAGLRSLGPVWSRPTIFAHGVPFAYPASPDTGPGLTDHGKELIKACNRLGIMIDLSHLNEKGFWDVAGLSEAPLVATHSNVHALCQSTRNLTDKQLDAIKASGGLVGVNFGVNDLWEDARRDANMPLEILVRHLDYLVARLGIDGVALGTDFDGTTISTEIGDAAGLPKLINALREHGYDDAALNKIGHENWLRVLAKTWK
ncbi:MAG TPA: dipeptidase [Ktedonobacteraceae bacterium]|nr:dipeptidase [Ktedonobacteraceae bacterium]